MKSIAISIVKSKPFSNLVFFLILLSAVTVGIETYPGLSDKTVLFLRLLDRVIISIFTIEIILRILAEGNRPFEFFKDGWNVFDFIIVAVCLVPAGDTHFFAVLRILRVLRVLRMITFFPKLRLIIGALLKSIPSMGFVTLLIGILFYVYAIVGVFLYGQKDPLHFGDLHHALVTLFKVLTLEGWTDIMNAHILGETETGDVGIISLWPFIYFASFILIGAMIIMNLFIGVIMNSMEESQKELAEEVRQIKENKGETGDAYESVITRLEELKEEIRSLKRAGKQN
jgi:voltage-gated sodium channel